MIKEELNQARATLIYDFDKMKPGDLLLYEKLNWQIACLELDEKYQKLLEFVKKFATFDSVSARKFILLQCEADELLKEMGEL